VPREKPPYRYWGSWGGPPWFSVILEVTAEKLPYLAYRIGASSADSTDAGCALRSALSKEEAMAESELYKKGTAIRSKLMGAKYAENMNKSVSTIHHEEIRRLRREAVFGMLWDRPGLDLKTKALICVVSDTAQARWPELAIHLRMARNQGWTRTSSARR